MTAGENFAEKVIRPVQVDGEAFEIGWPGPYSPKLMLVATRHPLDHRVTIADLRKALADAYDAAQIMGISH